MDNQTTQNSSGMMNGMPQTPQETKKVGPLFAILIIVAVLIIAALYFFGKKMDTTPVIPESNEIQQTTVESQNADDVDSLQADLNAELKDVDYSF